MKLVPLFLSFISVVGCLFSLSAQEYPSSYYELSPDGRTLLFWKGDTAVVNLALDPSLGRIDSIADFAFAHRDSLGNVIPDYTIEELILPHSLRSVGYMAFWCRNLRHLQLNEGLEFLDQATLCEAPLSSLDIPSSLRMLSGAIYRCYNLEWLRFGKKSIYYTLVEGVLLSPLSHSVTFYPSARLSESYVVPEGSSIIDFRAFAGSRFLSRLYLAEGVEVIEKEAMSDCVSLRLVDFPSTLKSLANDALVGSSIDTLVFRSLFPPQVEGTLRMENCRPVVLIVPDESLSLYAHYKPLQGVYETILPLSEMPEEWQAYKGAGEPQSRPFVVVGQQLVIELPEEGMEARVFNKEGEQKAFFRNSGSYTLSPGVYTLLLGGKSYKLVIPAIPM